jgi:hypothetical protein
VIGFDENKAYQEISPAIRRLINSVDNRVAGQESAVPTDVAMANEQARVKNGALLIDEVTTINGQIDPKILERNAKLKFMLSPGGADLDHQLSGYTFVDEKGVTVSLQDIIQRARKNQGVVSLHDKAYIESMLPSVERNGFFDNDIVQSRIKAQINADMLAQESKLRSVAGEYSPNKTTLEQYTAEPIIKNIAFVEVLKKLDISPADAKELGDIYDKMTALQGKLRSNEKLNAEDQTLLANLVEKLQNSKLAQSQKFQEELKEQLGKVKEARTAEFKNLEIIAGQIIRNEVSSYVSPDGLSLALGLITGSVNLGVTWGGTRSFELINSKTLGSSPKMGEAIPVGNILNSPLSKIGAELGATLVTQLTGTFGAFALGSSDFQTRTDGGLTFKDQSFGLPVGKITDLQTAYSNQRDMFSVVKAEQYGRQIGDIKAAVIALGYQNSVSQNLEFAGKADKELVERLAKATPTITLSTAKEFIPEQYAKVTSQSEARSLVFSNAGLSKETAQTIDASITANRGTDVSTLNKQLEGTGFKVKVVAFNSPDIAKFTAPAIVNGQEVRTIINGQYDENGKFNLGMDVINPLASNKDGTPAGLIILVDKNGKETAVLNTGCIGQNAIVTPPGTGLKQEVGGQIICLSGDCPPNSVTTAQLMKIYGVGNEQTARMAAQTAALLNVMRTDIEGSVSAAEEIPKMVEKAEARKNQMIDAGVQANEIVKKGGTTKEAIASIKAGNNNPVMMIGPKGEQVTLSDILESVPEAKAKEMLNKISNGVPRSSLDYASWAHNVSKSVSFSIGAGMIGLGISGHEDANGQVQASIEFLAANGLCDEEVLKAVFRQQFAMVEDYSVKINAVLPKPKPVEHTKPEEPVIDAKIDPSTDPTVFPPGSKFPEIRQVPGGYQYTTLDGATHFSETVPAFTYAPVGGVLNNGFTNVLGQGNIAGTDIASTSPLIKNGFDVAKNNVLSPALDNIKETVQSSISNNVPIVNLWK